MMMMMMITEILKYRLTQQHYAVQLTLLNAKCFGFFYKAIHYQAVQTAPRKLIVNNTQTMS
jgi:hypothetical protein